LERIPSDAAVLWQKTGLGNEPAGTPSDPDKQSGEEKRPLWPFILLVLLIVAVVESVFANRYVASETEEAKRKAQLEAA
ncbi:MAG: hypothetical protein ABI823_09085, partial [Bryobacteraceae bacterium]